LVVSTFTVPASRSIVMSPFVASSDTFTPRGTCTAKSNVELRTS
jgi:hypothetical protein